MLKNFKKEWRNYYATIMGLVVAIAQAWMTIDWTNFDIKKEWPKLVLSAAIAIGGWKTSLNVK